MTQPTQQPAEQLTQEQKATNAETWEHINTVSRLLASVQVELMRRQFTHDQSKLVPPEVEVFTEYTSKLKTSTYGSDEYKQNLRAMGPAIQHHYHFNRHHPEHYSPSREQGRHKADIDYYRASAEVMRQHAQLYPEAPNAHFFGEAADRAERTKAELESPINGMTLIDLVEMLCDWVAAVQRHDDGDINKSLEVNRERFNVSPQLQQIFENTIPWLQDEFEELKTQRTLPTVKRSDLLRDGSQVA